MEKNTVILDIDRYNELLEAAVRYELIKERQEEVRVNGETLKKWLKNRRLNSEIETEMRKGMIYELD